MAADVRGVYGRRDEDFAWTMSRYRGTQMSELAQKLHPDRFTEMSPLMARRSPDVLGVSWTDPQITEISVSEQEDLIYVRKVSDIGFDGVFSLTDSRNNWNRCSLRPV
jgi:hypothetical protein